MNIVLKIKTIEEDVKQLLVNVCRDLNKEDEIPKILKKYLNTNKVVKTKSKLFKNKRKKTAYSMFLKYNTIRKDNPGMTLEEYNVSKGKYWKTINPEEKDIYERKAREWNENNNKINEIDDKEIKEKVVKKEKKDLLDHFFDEEYMENKNVENKVEEI